MHGWSFIDRGAEPDNAYYIRNQSIVAGRNVDLASDPPPDLIVEVDIGHSGIDENSLYTAIGIGGIAVWSGTFTNCKEMLYTDCDRSPTFLIIGKEDLYQFLEQSQKDEIRAIKAFREFIKAKVKR